MHFCTERAPTRFRYMKQLDTMLNSEFIVNSPTRLPNVTVHPSSTFKFRDSIPIRNPYYTPDCKILDPIYPVRMTRITSNGSISTNTISSYDGRSDFRFLDINKRFSNKRLRAFNEQFDNFDMEAQSGPFQALDKISTIFKDVCKYTNVPVHDDLITEVEGLTALIVTIQGCVDYVSMSSAMFLYLRKHLSKSATSQALEYISDLFAYEPQSGSDIFGTSDWLTLMKNVRENWMLARESKLFSHFSKLLGLIVTVGLCKTSDLTFSIKDYKVWEPDMKLIHGSAVDIADAAFSTVIFFVESFSLAIKEKTLMPFIVNDRAAADLDVEFATLINWWDLVKNGNLTRLTNVTDNEFEHRVEALCTQLKHLMMTRVSFEKKLVQDKFMRLVRIKNDFVTLKLSSGVRRAPFALELFGESSQGKTTFGDQITDALLSSANMPTCNTYRASYNAGDRYMSNWKSDKLVLTIDDMANDKSDFVETSPTRMIINVCNNQPYYANMADLDSKGKVFVEPALCLVTTNKKNLDSHIYSNCPYSIQRRMHVVITVTAKREFQFIVDGAPQGIDSSKVAAWEAENNINAAFDDIWQLTVEKAVQPEELSHVAEYKPLRYRGEPLVNKPFRFVVQFLIDEFHKHQIQQTHIVSRMTGRKKKINLCPHENCKHIAGYCDQHDQLYAIVLDLDEPPDPDPPDDNEVQFGEVFTDGLESVKSMIDQKLGKDVFDCSHAMEAAITASMLKAASTFVKKWDWMSLVPTPWLNDAIARNVLAYINQEKLRTHYIRYTCLLWTLVALGLYFAIRNACSFWTFGTIFVLGFTVQKLMVEIVKKVYFTFLLNRRTLSPMMTSVRDNHVARLCKAFGIVGSLYAVSRMYRTWRSQPHGSLEPKTEEDVAKRDAEENVWTGVSVRALPLAPEAANTTAEQLRGLVDKNLVYGTVVADGVSYMVNGLFLTSNVVLLPNHYFITDELDVTFRKQFPDKSGGKFATRLSKSTSVRVPNTDFRICYSSTGGSFRNLSKYLPTTNPSTHDFTMFWRSKTGSVIKAMGLARYGPTGNGAEVFQGLKYELTIDTFKGLCGAVLLANHKPLISGIHLGGRTGTPSGCAGILTASQFEKAMSDLEKLEAVLISGSAEIFESQVLGVSVLRDVPLHPKSPLNYMPQESQVEYYGSCPGITTFKSDCKVTLISEHVTDVTGDPNIYGPPVQTPQYVGWQTCLANLAVPALPFETELLQHAVMDYKADLLPIFSSDLWRHSRPLNDHENLCGVPGKKFMDAIKLDTSIGFPLSGPKRNYVIELEPTIDKPNNREFEPIILEEIQRCEDCYKRGERAYPIAKACKKDEILSKPKCRIFYGNALPMTFLIRKYFLPLIRVLQMNPLVSECAVGVNSHGPEWNELHNHIFTFGKDRLFGGDYGKYDQKLPSQLLFAAIRILIDCAEKCDYSEDDLRVMRAMAGDLVFAVIAYNGDLIGLTEGCHISGNSLTVILNGICGSLNLRAYFYKCNPPKTFPTRMKFRDYVKLITYGDDNTGSVSPKIDNFTIRGASEFLAEYGQIYTMPDKESELSDFLPVEDFEFLKRTSVYHDEMNVFVGALADKSCLKMLHCYLRGKKSPLTEEHACAINIDTALREWFNHGRDVYEMRQAQMVEIAKRANITHLCNELLLTYDDRVMMWREKYEEGYEPFEKVHSLIGILEWGLD